MKLQTKKKLVGAGAQMGSQAMVAFIAFAFAASVIGLWLVALFLVVLIVLALSDSTIAKFLCGVVALAIFFQIVETRPLWLIVPLIAFLLFGLFILSRGAQKA